MQGPKCQSKALSFFILADGGQTPPQTVALRVTRPLHIFAEFHRLRIV